MSINFYSVTEPTSHMTHSLYRPVLSALIKGCF